MTFIWISELAEIFPENFIPNRIFTNIMGREKCTRTVKKYIRFWDFYFRDNLNFVIIVRN